MNARGVWLRLCRCKGISELWPPLPGSACSDVKAVLSFPPRRASESPALLDKNEVRGKKYRQVAGKMVACDVLNFLDLLALLSLHGTENNFSLFS